MRHAPRSDFDCYAAPAPIPAPPIGRWIKHDGSAMPVDGGVKIIPQFRGESPLEAEREARGLGSPAWGFAEFWTHTNGPEDIVGYLVTEPRS